MELLGEPVALRRGALWTALRGDDGGGCTDEENSRGNVTLLIIATSDLGSTVGSAKTLEGSDTAVGGALGGPMALMLPIGLERKCLASGAGDDGMSAVEDDTTEQRGVGDQAGGWMRVGFIVIEPHLPLSRRAPASSVTPVASDSTASVVSESHSGGGPSAVCSVNAGSR